MRRTVGVAALALGFCVVTCFGTAMAVEKGDREPLVNRVSPPLKDSRGSVANILSPILIPGIQEPDEMRVEPFPVTTVVPTAPERMLWDAMKSAGNNSDPAALLPALNQILAKYPDFSDGYVMRLGALCGGNDRGSILSNVNSALKFVQTSRVGKDSIGSLLSMRAKIEHANGDDRSAMDDLERAINADLEKAIQFANTGGVAPEKTASACSWTAPDMDALVQRFPRDYRSYLFRGLYYAFFTTFGNEDSLKPAIDNLGKAVEFNANSPLPHFLKSEVLGRAFFFKRIGMSEAQRAELYNLQLDELNKALALAPDLLPALKGRAQILYDLKRFRQAIADYDKILARDPNDFGAYNDRGLANMELGRPYDAISDFTKAIENRKRGLFEFTSPYEGRAEAYVKTRQWDLAIGDLTTAISTTVGQRVLVAMDVRQFREIYPEYRTASDEAIARKLNQTFYPDMKFEDFSKGFLDGTHALPSLALSDLYLKRSDAYLKQGKWRRASIEFQRVAAVSSEDAIDRWGEIGQTANTRNYIDMRTFDHARGDAIKIWIKQARGSSDDIGPYSVQQFELNCSARQIRALSIANYDASGELTGSREGGRWGSVVPDTLGETLYNGACRSN